MARPPTEDETAFAAGVMPLLTRASRLGYALLAPRLQSEGISLADFRLVGALLGEPTGVSQRELAARLEVRPPTVSAAVDKLVAAGVVERLPSPDDARAYRVRLAKRARGLGAALAHVQALEERALRGLSAVERAELRRLLALVVDNLSADVAEIAPAAPSKGSR